MKKSFGQRLGRDLKYNTALYVMIIPVVLWYLIFVYKPMLGTVMAFYEYSPVRGYEKSTWKGIEYFITYLGGRKFPVHLRNTLVHSCCTLFIGFPSAVVLALLINEVRCQWFKKTIQTMTYLPHFVSLVVCMALVKQFCFSDGLFNDIVVALGGERSSMLMNPSLYMPIYVLSGLWKEIGWSTIIYLAALAAVDVQLYEAARLDGAGRLKQAIHVTIPGIMPTIVIRFIMNVGAMMSVGYEKTLLLYNYSVDSVAEIISSYMYRVGIGGATKLYGLSAAVDVFNAIVNVLLVIMANKLSRKFTESSLW